MSILACNSPLWNENCVYHYIRINTCRRVRLAAHSMGFASELRFHRTLMENYISTNSTLYVSYIGATAERVIGASFFKS